MPPPTKEETWAEEDADLKVLLASVFVLRALSLPRGCSSVSISFFSARDAAGSRGVIGPRAAMMVPFPTLHTRSNARG